MGGRGRSVGYWRGWGKGGEMTQTLYAHVNKKKQLYEKKMSVL
jgi:hypothetical protein